MVDIQQRLVQVGQVQVVFCFVILGEGLVLRRWELAERRQVGVDVSDVETMWLVEVTIPEEETMGSCSAFHVGLVRNAQRKAGRTLE